MLGEYTPYTKEKFKKRSVSIIRVILMTRALKEHTHREQKIGNQETCLVAEGKDEQVICASHTNLIRRVLHIYCLENGYCLDVMKAFISRKIDSNEREQQNSR